MKYLTVLLAIFVLVSCSSLEKSTESVVPNNGQQFDVEVGEKKITEAQVELDVPSWYLNPPEGKDMLYSSGYAKMSDKQNSMKKAQMKAKADMAEVMGSAIKSIRKIYMYEDKWAEDMKDGGKNYSAFINTFSSYSTESVSAFLVGAKREEVYFDAEGGCYVLMSITTDNIYSQISSVAMGYGMSSDIIEVIQGKLEKQIVDSE